MNRMRFIGLDPGGKKHFGWCVLEGRTLPLTLAKFGCVSDAAAAVDAVLRVVGDAARIDGVGIDSPLFWAPAAKRRVDSLVREAITSIGPPSAGGTVQEVNSLRGACLVQGMMAAHLIRRALPDVRITEAHPKALLWLVKVASNARHVRAVRMEHLDEYFCYQGAVITEHERDAALAAIAAWAMTTSAPGWRDISIEDSDAVMLVPHVEYWMPIEEASPVPSADPARLQPARTASAV